MSITTILIQVVITLVVVGFYHVWVSGNKQQAAPPPTPAPAPPVVPPVAAAPMAAAPIAQTAATTPKPAPASQETSPEILAVIAAAVAVVLGRPYRVVSVERTPTPVMNVWALEGRVEQFMSHKIR